MLTVLSRILFKCGLLRGGKMILLPPQTFLGDKCPPPAITPLTAV